MSSTFEQIWLIDKFSVWQEFLNLSECLALNFAITPYFLRWALHIDRAKKKNNCHFRVDKLKKFALFLKVCGIWFTVYMQVVQCMWNISLPWVTGKHNKEKSNSIWKQWTKVLGRGSASANLHLQGSISSRKVLFLRSVYIHVFGQV